MRRLMLGLLVGVLMAASLPGVAVAKPKVDTSPCKNGGWADWVRTDGTAFANQDACVAYVARGGTLMPPTPPVTFQSECVNRGGTFTWDPRYYMGATAPNCEWSEVSLNSHVGNVQALLPLCTGQPDEYGYLGTAVYWNGDRAPDPRAWVGCYPS